MLRRPPRSTLTVTPFPYTTSFRSMAMALASGNAATTAAITTIAEAGDNIVSSTDLYGGTWNLFAHTLKAMGIEAWFVDPADPDAFRRAADGRTRAFFRETLPNPNVVPFPTWAGARIGEKLGIPLIVDKTAAPQIRRPFAQGHQAVDKSEKQPCEP